MKFTCCQAIVLPRHLMCLSMKASHNVFFPSARTLAHLALAAAASLALTDGLLRRSFFLAVFALAFAPFKLAIRIFRALARALMSLRLWAAVM